jgi:shikimate kinase
MLLHLIGYRGSGKTAVAAALSEQLGWPWIDADAELERRAGKTIKQLFADHGETAFRDLEAAVAADLVENDQQIIAWGGGVILREPNRQLLQRRGKIIWLTASPETLLARMSGDVTTAERRPNLTGQGGLAEIRTLLDQRTPLYAACADLTIDTELMSPADIARRIITELHLQE